MKTTLIANINGVAFLMEEDGYVKLELYLKTLKQKLGNNSEADEVVGDIEARIAELLDLYKSQGIDRIVALRGDLPSGQVGLGELPYAQDLVRFIREHSGNHFHIEVAAYPEMHPQADSFDADIKRFVEKVNAGANAGITQFFFNPDAYFYFIERLEKEGINIPVAPGIMPITNASNLIRFADGTGAEIPRWIRKQLAAYGDDSESIKAFGHEVIVKLCERLIAGGAPTLHFYSMNQTEPTRQLVVDLGMLCKISFKSKERFSSSISFASILE